MKRCAVIVDVPYVHKDPLRRFSSTAFGDAAYGRVVGSLQALHFEPGTHVVSSGALATESGKKTGRSPKDKRVVRECAFEKDIWWGKYSPNYMMDDRQASVL
eukprot:GHUV01029470.1.p1 GENE.GHUV01029470.1~~GHUV01029470.1.p1  ORF type:complete len:102 (-),score=5.15 GHUV01029470.1:19-324(-)